MPLGVLEADGRADVKDGRSTRQTRLWPLGCGEWTGAASATLAGVTRSARDTVHAIEEILTPGRT